MSRRSKVSTALVLATACSTTVLTLQPPASAAGVPSNPASHASPTAAKSQDALADIDLRKPSSQSQQRSAALRSARAEAKPAVQSLAHRLGDQSVVDIDALTGTPRQVSRLNGLLTGRSHASPTAIALNYVRDNAAVFGLSETDLSRLKLNRDYVDIAGIHHLGFVQSMGGLPLFGNGLKANVTKDGRLINVTGSPVANLRAPATLKAGLSVDAAIRVSKKAAGEKSVAPAKGDTGKPVLFQTPGGTRRAVQTITMSAKRPTLDVVDAETGRILYRDQLSADLGGDQADVVDYYPGAASGGRPHTVSLNRRGWLPRHSPVLFGNNVHTYTDANDDNQPNSDEEISPSPSTGYRYPLVRLKIPDEPCVKFVCTWDPEKAYSWKQNDERASVQNFYYVNLWHDYLAKAPIGFTEAAGNFQQVNASGQGQGGDPIHNESLDGADTDGGVPDLLHIDNANFATPPDGQSPTMQMYLWHAPGYTFPQEPILASMGADDASIVFHEYGHGLSHRLITDANNNPALDSVQGSSMGEAWSDWYAQDYTVSKGFQKDTKRPGDVLMGEYVFAGSGIRSEGIDCPVGSKAISCPGTQGTEPGGYTYGDFGRIFDATGDVHAAGEIWAQTLWDLRRNVGSTLARSLVTRGMELSPTNPSFLDMRNAIVQADVAIYSGKHTAKIWATFAHRGMGFFAGAMSGDDLHPVEDFTAPPAANGPKGTLTGLVKDKDTGAPVVGATVAFGGHNSGFPGDYAATTGKDGKYAISGIAPGTYPDVFVGGAGYDPEVTALSVGRGTVNRNWLLRRDWAASSGGGTITDFNGADYTNFGCGPINAIDQSLGQGWGSDTVDGAKFIIIKLPQAVEVSTIAVDPSNTCGDRPEAATAGYSVETSTDGVTWKPSSEGTFTAADLGRLNPLTAASGSTSGVQYVRFTMKNPQGTSSQYLDSSEVAVYGVPSAS